MSGFDPFAFVSFNKGWAFLSDKNFLRARGRIAREALVCKRAAGTTSCVWNRNRFGYLRFSKYETEENGQPGIVAESDSPQKVMYGGHQPVPETMQAHLIVCYVQRGKNSVVQTHIPDLSQR